MWQQLKKKQAHGHREPLHFNVVASPLLMCIQLPPVLPNQHEDEGGDGDYG